jgi:hypothetical protein
MRRHTKHFYAGEKLRKQAIERTRAHTRKETGIERQLEKALVNHGGGTLASYMRDEAANLKRMEALHDVLTTQE